MARRIATIVLGVLVLGAVAGVFYLTNTDNASIWYVRVDDAAAQRKDDGDEEVWEYTLDAYDEHGGHRQLAFTASKRLRDGAYLKLGYMPVREVVSWEEVQPDQVPDAARERLA
ncbi:YxeA family protein [Olsenella sp. Marseille-P4559]|jgi:uncharacterized protein (TIGR01655 family)|uniref:YxeA family protein n=1 Tax=Olsenella sp. Marseille-P4559 TaxID=2364795 RepID=UPI0010311412|nr:YxeA family protein [Olsenella sp. Marseille-P4559]